MSVSPHVAITIVTFNSCRYIAGCLTAALAQSYPSFEIVVVDNASQDQTARLLAGFADRDRLRVFLNQRNVGFAGGQNQAIAAASDAHWLITLNPDVQLPPDFLLNLLDGAESDPDVGSMCGKLLAISPDGILACPPLLDSAGIYFTPQLRHLDRGQHLPDSGQYDRPEYVFGGTGAACAYRAAMIRDISVFGEFFDTDFFAYREDADVAWRAQLLGWRCLYQPTAVAYHVRTVRPENRRALPAVINMHSVKNRWLLRIKNTTPALYRRFWLPITLRDMVVIGGCLFGEWKSLPAFWRVLKLWNRAWAKRREIMRRRHASDESMAIWFSHRPVSQPRPQ